MSYAEAEAAFSARVAQPLLLQEPLQAVLLDLFRRLIAQGAAIEGLQAALGAVESREQEAAARSDAALRELEARLAAERHTAAQAAADSAERLQRLELRLHGASNLAGRQAALDDIASMLGVSVPEVQVSAPAPRLLISGVAAASHDAVPASTIACLESTLANSFVQLDSSRVTQAEGDGTEMGAAGAASAAAIDASPLGGVSVPAAPVSLSGTTLPPATAQQPVAPAETTSSAAGAPGTVLLNARPGSAAQHSDADVDALRAEQQEQGSTILQPLAAIRPEADAVPRPDELAAGLPSEHPDAAPPSSQHDLQTEQQQQAQQQQRNAAQPAARPEVPSPAALFDAVRAGKSRVKAAGHIAQPAEAKAIAHGRERAALAVGLNAAGPAAAVGPAAEAAESAAVTVPAAAKRPATPAVAAQPADSNAARSQGADGAAPADEEPTPAVVRPKSAAASRLAEVVHMLRKRTSLQQTGLLWKLQASLAESVTEQERLRGHVESLQDQLASLQSASGEGLAHCNKRIDSVEEGLAAAATPAVAEPSSASSLPTARSRAPHMASEELRALQEQVEAGAAKLASLEERARAEAQHLSQLEGRVLAGEQRLGRLEERAEAEAAAVKLVRASSSGSREDTLDALRGHLLAQQQKLQERMEALAGGISEALPGQVHDAVTGAVVEVGRGLERRLAEKLATKQDLQTVSLKVASKVTREEVERMLRAHRAALPGAVEPGSGPAAGMRFKCLSCDGDMQPFVFAAPPGALPFPHQQHSGGSASLRYSQLPVASPPRSSSQAWTAAAAPLDGAAAASPEVPPSRLGGAASVGGAMAATSSATTVHVQLPRGPLPARPSTSASRLGAPVSWMHCMRRETSATCGQEGGGHGSRRESGFELRLGSQPSPSAGAVARPQSAFPAAAGPTPRSSVGGFPQRPSEGEGQKEADRTSADFFDAIREEPPAGSTPAGAAAARSAGPKQAEVAMNPRPRASLGGGGSKSAAGVLPALAAPTGRIKAVRPATAALVVSGGIAATADSAALQLHSAAGSGLEGEQSTASTPSTAAL